MPWPIAHATFPQQKSGLRRAHPRRSRHARARQKRLRACRPPAAAQPAAATGRHGHPSRGPARRLARCCPIDRRAHAGSFPGRSLAPSPRVRAQAARGQRHPDRCRGAAGTMLARARAPRRPDRAVRPIASQGGPSALAPWMAARLGGLWWMSKWLASRRAPPAKTSDIPGRAIAAERYRSSKTDQSCYFLFQKKTTSSRLEIRPDLSQGGVSLKRVLVLCYWRAGCASSARRSSASNARRAMISVSSRPSSL